MTGTIYASERAEDIDYKISHECVVIENEDGARILLTDYEVLELANSDEEVFDVEDAEGDNVITLEIEQIRELATKF
ncbi:hypothetical protein D0962_34560 [Leptolyngbyaceae cyanobacterium CCMR0082]|uniref:Uncharacterized protein n=1 Tax=Adonisia turfae CCMR0082 TaxID=2304604 RepID=A0A6M0SIM3_9CYAN|nr:hypothetical protein [Adonisia turfae]NEZ67821.1 hypothetical protein [Adonisia turfae CCMR0082]